MCKVDQLRIVKELAAGMVASVEQALSAGKIPKEWDGHELRTYVADLASRNASMSVVTRHPESTRAKAYENHVLAQYL